MRCGSCEIGIGNWGAEKEAAYKLPKTRSNFPVSMSPSTMSSASSSSSHRLPAIVYSHSSKWLEKFSPPPSISLNSPFPWRAPSPQFGCLWSLGVSEAHIFCVVVLYSDALSASPLVEKKKKKIAATVFTSSSLLFFAQTPCGLLENGCVPFPFEKACMGLTLMIFHCSSFNFTLELRPNLPRNVATIAVCVDEPELELELCRMWAPLNPWAFPY